MNQLDPTYPKRHCNAVPYVYEESFSTLYPSTLYHVVCRHCGKRTDGYLTKDLVIDMWNKGRHHSQKLIYKEERKNGKKKSR